MNLVKKILTDAAAGADLRTQDAWLEASLPDTGAITVEQLEKARANLQGA
ncbi:hypothetical protein [Streptomyces lydicus]|nr:hypothetical protein [Streptomyces lydicus]MCZ1012264.1 hypothetical protein [Streptomyces lydicus]